LEKLLGLYREESQSLVSETLEAMISDLFLLLSSELERVRHLSPERRMLSEDREHDEGQVAQS
jgi:hypothetical protein